jgi:hypothetical protein
MAKTKYSQDELIKIMENNYDYIHYTNYKDIYENMLSGITEKIFRNRKEQIDNQIQIINSFINKIYEGNLSEMTLKDNVKVQTVDLQKFIIGENDPVSLAINLLQRPASINSSLKTLSSNKTKNSSSGNLENLREFIGLFGGKINFKQEKDNLELSLTPDTTFSSSGIQPLKLNNLKDYTSIAKKAGIELEQNKDANYSLQGTGGEIGGALLMASALATQKDTYEVLIQNLGKKSLSQSSKSFKINIGDEKFKQLIKDKEKKINSITKIVNNFGEKEKTVTISPLNKQGKVDFSIGDLNVSVKNYWSGHSFNLGTMNLAGLLTLISVYYPEYGWNTKNYHIFINLLALKGVSGHQGNILKNNYKKIMKNLLIGYDVDILFLSRYGIPILINAFDAYETDNYFKLNGQFSNFDNKFLSEKSKEVKAGLHRSELI